MHEAWSIATADGFEKSFRRWRKRHPDACDATWARLQNFQDRWLNNPQLGAGFGLPGWVHAEGRGVLAVDQGTRAGLAAMRLYLWLDEEERTVWLLRMGDKSSQHADIAYCHAWREAFDSGDED
jgi:hypothetical protein